jgi:hypothetical protein
MVYFSVEIYKDVLLKYGFPLAYYVDNHWTEPLQLDTFREK